MGFMLMKIASQFHLLDFVIQNLMFNPQTADGRMVILEYGSREIVGHPFFGIGLSDWVRPYDKERERRQLLAEPRDALRAARALPSSFARWRSAACGSPSRRR